MVHKLSHASPICDGATDKWLICESLAELAQSAQGHGSCFGSGSEEAKKAQTGELSRVADADAYLAKLESLSVLSAKRSWQDNVTGSVPNVGAYLAGSPTAMRFRRSSREESAPLGIVFDGTTSGGISDSDMTKRGVVVLALVRMLAMRRPVELWLAAGLGGSNSQGSWVATRLETAPLDLARACYALSNPKATRVLGYSAIYGAHTGSDGCWPYNGSALTADKFHAVASRAFPHLTDILAIPGILNSDALLKNPEAWLRAQVAKYCEGEE